MMGTITVIKLNPSRDETWRYTGELLLMDETAARLEALFNRDDFWFEGVLLKRGDRFLEEYYSDRWYNIYEIYDRDDGKVKCWYCNVSMPAEFDGDTIRFVDLALDLLVMPDGEQKVLDVDEFMDLELSDEVRGQAWNAVRELKALVQPNNGFLLGKKK